MCNICFRNSPFKQLMAKSKGKDFFTRHVVLLKKSDFVNEDGKTCMPTLMEMDSFRKSPTRRRENVLFSKSMSDEEVKKTLQEEFDTPSSFKLTAR